MFVDYEQHISKKGLYTSNGTDLDTEELAKYNDPGFPIFSFPAFCPYSIPELCSIRVCLRKKVLIRQKSPGQGLDMKRSIVCMISQRHSWGGGEKKEVRISL